MSVNHYIAQTESNQSNMDVESVIVSLGGVDCKENDLCAQNCILVKSNEHYSVNMTKQIHEDNQTKYEN